MNGTENVGPLAISPALVFIQIVGFLLLLWALNQWVFKPIFAILDERQKTIQETYDQMDADRKRMEDTRLQYEQRLAGIEAEAREKIQAAVKEAQALRDNLKADAEQQAEAILAHGRNEAERERQKAFLEMRQQVVSLAVAAAGKVVGEALNEPRHIKLVDDFIAEIGANSVAGTVGVQSQTQNGTQKGVSAA